MADFVLGRALTALRFQLGERSAQGFMHVLSGLACVVVLLLGTRVAHAELEIPQLRGHVTDQAKVLSVSGRESLEVTLTSYERATGHQFAFLSIPSLEGAPIEDFSMRVAEKWKLGDEKRDDGLILVIAQQDRKMRIEVGYGLEGVIPDALAAKIIRHQLTPAFQKGDFEGGIDAAFSTLMKAAEGEAVRVGPSDESGDQRSLVRPLFWLFALLIIVLMNRGAGAGRGGGGGLGAFAAGAALGSLGGRRYGGGGFGGGFGGGGFGGGGGGFGGGGSSGGW